MFKGGETPEKGLNFYDVGIEIFLRSRPEAVRGYDRIDILRKAAAEGRVASKKLIRPGLEEWIITEKDNLDPGAWYVATDLVDMHPDGAVLWCRGLSDPKFARCSTAENLIPGIWWDMRFRAIHVQDWPEIFTETIRVLQLLKKV